MPPRTSAGNIRSIAQDIPATAELRGYIQAANVLVTNICAVSGSPYDAPTLELIERYVAAHLYFVDQQRTMLERVGSAEVQYQQFRGDAMGLASTAYGQMAKTLDYNLYLAGVENMSAKQLNRQRGIIYLGRRCYPIGPCVDGAPYSLPDVEEAGPYT